MSRGRPAAGRRAASTAAPADVTVAITDRQRLLRVERPWLRRVVSRAVAAAGFERAEVGILIVDDAGIAALHERWLGLTGPTDVITFDLSMGGPAMGLQGDIAVSAETARRVARELGWPPRHELAYYVVHGILHLAGEDDREAAERRRMRSRERTLMVAAGLPPPPTARRRGSRGAR